MSNIKLELRNVAAGYEDKPILKNVNCIVRSGEICCLLGPNGVGKTTLFKTILGLIPPVSGSVLMDGQDTSTWSARQLADNIAYVSQFHNPPFPYKVKDVVLLGRVSQAGYFGKVSELDYEIAQQAMVDMGVIHLAEKPYTDISGGERQLVMIARALTQQPKWLMMDEPTASLDYGNMIRVISRIVELRDRGYGIIMTTHLPDQAFMCDAKVGLLQRGSSMKFGDAAEIITEENMRETYGVGVSVAELFDRSGHLMRMCVPEIGSAGDPSFHTSASSEETVHSDAFTPSEPSSDYDGSAYAELPVSSTYVSSGRSAEQELAGQNPDKNEEQILQSKATQYNGEFFSQAVTTPYQKKPFSGEDAAQDHEESFSRSVAVTDTSSAADSTGPDESENQVLTQDTILDRVSRRDHRSDHHRNHDQLNRHRDHGHHNRQENSLESRGEFDHSDRNHRHEHRHRTQRNDNRHSGHDHPQRLKRTGLKTGRTRPASFHSERTSPAVSQESRQTADVYTPGYSGYGFSPDITHEITNHSHSVEFSPSSAKTNLPSADGSGNRSVAYFADSLKASDHQLPTVDLPDNTSFHRETQAMESGSIQSESSHRASNENDRWKPSRDSYARQSAPAAYKPHHHHHDEGRHHRRHRRNALIKEE